ncbi:hypothetical protein DERP_009840 [Dermatophagoides pteronyssinus]|uniref:Uncharacterized protein n=1 Tax=Dermatophagoides pteronyssinus TaxID=6956 RepID=A0ABQ8IRF9_DERPT|nr:hypothetical protein DERP_009840 [Dermatophagoides pteronyssinus]
MNASKILHFSAYHLKGDLLSFFYKNHLRNQSINVNSIYHHYVNGMKVRSKIMMTRRNRIEIQSLPGFIDGIGCSRSGGDFGCWTN